MQKWMHVLAGVVFGVILTTTVSAVAQWNERGKPGSRPDSELLERMVRAQEELARQAEKQSRALGEVVRPLQDAARAEGEVARALGELKSRCR